MRQWFHENSVAFTSVQRMSDIRSSRSLPLVPASFGLEVREFLGRWFAGEHDLVGKLDGRAVRRRERADARGRVEEAGLGVIADQVAVHHQESLRDGARSCIEFIFAAIAVPLDELRMADASHDPNEDGRLRIDRRQRRGLKQASDDLVGSKPSDRERRPRLARGPRSARRRACFRAGRPRARRSRG